MPPYRLYLLPFLLCPLSMGVMMWFMMRGMNGMHNSQQEPHPTTLRLDTSMVAPPDVRLDADARVTQR